MKFYTLSFSWCVLELDEVVCEVECTMLVKYRHLGTTETTIDRYGRHFLQNSNQHKTQINTEANMILVPVFLESGLYIFNKT